jgi:UDP-N-acetylglucosamine 2-epimerase (non-hydrolysing)
MKLDLIAGARPNFMKISSIIKAIEKAVMNGNDIQYRLIHTGQHYDKNMSGSFFSQLQLPKPHYNLGAGSGTQAEQTAAIMLGYERLLMQEKSDLCLVVGDVTSTMACAIVAQKMCVKVAHVEGGIRSGDWSMPEEINRIVTDSITNYFFTTSITANLNLQKTGVPGDSIFFVGNTMIDTLLLNRSRFREPDFWGKINLSKENYLVITLHRPSNVDSKENLEKLVNAIIEHSKNLMLIFPVHPRTKKVLDSININNTRLFITEPLSYLEFNFLVERAKAVITDSGGITEETTVMGVPCITLRNSTERPETVTIGTNELIGTNPESLKPALDKLLSGNWKTGSIPEKWDGKTGERIVEILLNLFEKKS